MKYEACRGSGLLQASFPLPSTAPQTWCGFLQENREQLKTLHKTMDKILIVDDEHNVHYSFRRVLGNEYEILSAFSGDEALRQIDDDSLRLVLMDVRMPGVGGLDALQELKQRRPDLPVIMMTAFVSAETAIRATTLD
ncbi:MAG: response regulator, partial [Candidatus Binatia bacterium]